MSTERMAEALCGSDTVFSQLKSLYSYQIIYLILSVLADPILCLWSFQFGNLGNCVVYPTPSLFNFDLVFALLGKYLSYKKNRNVW